MTDPAGFHWPGGGRGPGQRAGGRTSQPERRDGLPSRRHCRRDGRAVNAHNGPAVDVDRPQLLQAWHNRPCKDSARRWGPGTVPVPAESVHVHGSQSLVDGRCHGAMGPPKRHDDGRRRRRRRGPGTLAGGLGGGVGAVGGAGLGPISAGLGGVGRVGGLSVPASWTAGSSAAGNAPVLGAARVAAAAAAAPASGVGPGMAPMNAMGSRGESAGTPAALRNPVRVLPRPDDPYRPVSRVALSEGSGLVNRPKGGGSNNRPHPDTRDTQPNMGPLANLPGPL